MAYLKAPPPVLQTEQLMNDMKFSSSITAKALCLGAKPSPSLFFHLSPEETLADSSLLAKVLAIDHLGTILCLLPLQTSWSLLCWHEDFLLHLLQNPNHSSSKICKESSPGN